MSAMALSPMTLGTSLNVVVLHKLVSHSFIDNNKNKVFVYEYGDGAHFMKIFLAVAPKPISPPLANWDGGDGKPNLIISVLANNPMFRSSFAVQ